jgi:hypothetical protein
VVPPTLTTSGQGQGKPGTPPQVSSRTCTNSQATLKTVSTVRQPLWFPCARELSQSPQTCYLGAPIPSPQPALRERPTKQSAAFLIRDFTNKLVIMSLTIGNA